VNILVGYCGQITLGAGASMAVGAYAAYNFLIRVDGMPALAAILLGGLMAAVAGIVFGIPSLRVRGLYLAVATLASQFFWDWAFLRIKWFTNNSSSGSVSVADINLFGWTINSPSDKYLFCLGVLVVFSVMAKNLVRGNMGRQWMAIRDMDVAATVIGIRPMYAKLTAFAVSSFYLGVAGALWGFVNLGSWEPAAFSIDRSLQLLFMVIIGGMGAIVRQLLRRRLHRDPADLPQPDAAADRGLFGLEVSIALVSHVEIMVFGSLIVFFLIVEPHGIARLWSTGQGKAAFVALPALNGEAGIY
jgi:branched-chain amino acid transport system permease protein